VSELLVIALRIGSIRLSLRTYGIHSPEPVHWPQYLRFLWFVIMMPVF